MAHAFAPGAKGRLTTYDLGRFPGNTLFDRLGRALCHAGCLPRKELYESWEVARRVRRLLPGGRVIDVGGGHGLLAGALLLLDDSSPSACVVDPALPPSHARVHDALVAAWPRLAGRVMFVPQSLDAFEVSAEDLIVSSHACGALTDGVLDRAISVRARVAVLPCCHDLARLESGGLAGWVDPTLAIDLVRATRLREQGYRIWTQTIPDRITPKNRLLIGIPAEFPS
jgi:hypothetical protein